MRREYILIFLVFFIAGLLIGPFKSAAAKTDHAFITKPGSRWTFYGNLQTQDFASAKSRIWEMQVRSVLERGFVTTARVSGRPLPTENSGPSAQQEFLIVKAADQFYGIGAERMTAVLSRLADPEDSLAGLVRKDDFLFDENHAGFHARLSQHYVSRPSVWYGWIMNGLRPLFESKIHSSGRLSKLPD